MSKCFPRRQLGDALGVRMGWVVTRLTPLNIFDKCKHRWTARNCLLHRVVFIYLTKIKPKWKSQGVCRDTFRSNTFKEWVSASVSCIILGEFCPALLYNVALVHCGLQHFSRVEVWLWLGLCNTVIPAILLLICWCS